MEIEQLEPGTLVLVELSHEYEGNEFFHYERATFVGLDSYGPQVRAYFEEAGFPSWEAYLNDGQWFRCDSYEFIPGESVENVRLVEVLS